VSSGSSAGIHGCHDPVLFITVLISFSSLIFLLFSILIMALTLIVADQILVFHLVLLLENVFYILFPISLFTTSGETLW